MKCKSGRGIGNGWVCPRSGHGISSGWVWLKSGRGISSGWVWLKSGHGISSGWVWLKSGRGFRVRLKSGCGISNGHESGCGYSYGSCDLHRRGGRVTEWGQSPRASPCTHAFVCQQFRQLDLHVAGGWVKEGSWLGTVKDIAGTACVYMSVYARACAHACVCSACVYACEKGEREGGKR